MYYIIDISHHNDLTRKDFEDLKKKGVKGVIIRSGYGKSIKQVDKKFLENYKMCRDLGFKIGTYWYTYATTVSDIITECNCFLYTIKDLYFDLPIFLDVEEKDQLSMKNEELNNMIRKALYFLKENKYDCGLYMSDGYLYTKIDEDIKTNYITWSANWSNFIKIMRKVSVNSYMTKMNYQVLQFTSMYKINNKEVDMSYSILEDKTDEYRKNQKNGFRKKDLEQLYEEIMKGLWGNGPVRKTNLEKHGYNYREVQNYVNKKLRGGLNK